MKPHRKACSLTAALITFGSLVTGANAAIVSVNGGFSASFDNFDPNYQGIPSVEGGWELTYDDQGGSFTGVLFGAVTFFRDTFGNSITIGATDFDEGNVSANISLNSGSITTLSLEGVGSTFDPVNPFTAFDMIDLEYTDFVDASNSPGALGSLNDVVVADADSTAFANGFPSFQNSIARSGEFSAVPEPSGATLLGLSMIGLLAYRRRIN